VIDRDVEWTAPDTARRLPARKIVLTEHRLDLAEMCVLFLVAEPDFLDVRQEDQRYVELIGVAAALRLAAAQIDAGALGFEDSKSVAKPVEQSIVGLPALIEREFEPDAVAITELPLGILEKLVDLDAGESFIGHAVSASRGPLLMSP
jgi:hypothetical protein